MERLRRTFSLRKSKRSKKDKSGVTTEIDKPQEWQEDERKVRDATCSFQVKYLGVIEVFESRGMQVCEEAIKALMKQSKKKSIQQCILYISGDALRVVDEISKGLIVDQTIEKVSFCAPDRNHAKGFAYICRDATTRRWLCHGFLAVKETGERLSHAVGCAFAICLEKKQKREKEAVEVTFNESKTSFTRVGSFKPTSITERRLDPQSAIIVEPLVSTHPHAVVSAAPSTTTTTAANNNNNTIAIHSLPSSSSASTAGPLDNSAFADSFQFDHHHHQQQGFGGNEGKISPFHQLQSSSFNNNHSNASNSAFLPRPRASINLLEKQGSLRMFPKLQDANSPFKRDLSLRLTNSSSHMQRLPENTFATPVQSTVVEGEEETVGQFANDFAAQLNMLTSQLTLGENNNPATTTSSIFASAEPPKLAPAIAPTPISSSSFSSPPLRDPFSSAPLAPAVQEVRARQQSGFSSIVVQPSANGNAFAPATAAPAPPAAAWSPFNQINSSWNTTVNATPQLSTTTYSTAAPNAYRPWLASSSTSSNVERTNPFLNNNLATSQPPTFYSSSPRQGVNLNHF